MAPRIAIATNNGDMGGGEVMLLRIADGLQQLGITPVVVAPSHPRDLVEAARAQGFETIVLPARSRRAWMMALRRWRRRHPRTPLWCNGLVPALATTGLGPRIVHLHRTPQGLHRPLVTLAKLGARRTLVISHHMAASVAGAVVMENWTAPLTCVPRPETAGTFRVGYLGRLTRGKGLVTLGEALQRLHAEGHRVELLIAGSPVHAAAEDSALIDRALTPLNGAVTYLGWVKPTELFRQVDVVAIPSVADEGFGLVAAEAMAAGVPFVVSDSGALPEVVGPSFPWIARRGDPDDLARVLLRRWEDDASPEGPAHRHEARQRWCAEYSPAAGVRRLAMQLMTLTDSSRPHVGVSRDCAHTPARPVGHDS